MINRQEAAEHLCELGYKARAEKGIVFVEVEQPLSKKERNKLEKILNGMGYTSSWGWGVKREKENHGK